MTDSRRKMAARVVRVLALLASVWGILLLIDDLARNNAWGYMMLAVGPLIMLGARWVDPGSETLSADLPDATSGEDAPSQDPSSQATHEEPQ